jgi:DNA-binding CsgD family transcriptional regulator
LLLETFHGFDASALLPTIIAPTLVIHRRGYRFPGPEAARFLAAEIPDARMLVLEGESGPPFAGDMETAAAAVEAYLGESSAAGLPAGLSRREAEVLGLLAAGKSNLEISYELILSLRTVERHITNVYGKLGVRNRAEATAYACSHGLI